MLWGENRTHMNQPTENP